MRFAQFFFLFFSFLLSLTHSTVTPASDYHSPRTAALGGAGHAGPMLNDALYLNPSFGSLLPSYSFSFGFVKFRSDDLISTPDGISNYYGRNYNLSLQDGRSELFQAGTGYTKREDGSTLHMGASKAVIKELGFGIGGKIFFPRNDTDMKLNDMSFSMTGVPSDWFQSSLTIDNLVQSAHGRSLNWLREFILGTKFNIMEMLMLYIDPHYVPALSTGQRFGYELGMELALMKDLFFRLGEYKNSTIPYQSNRGQGFGIGIGWFAPRISFDYAYSRNLHSFSNLPATNAHTFGFTAYF